MSILFSREIVDQPVYESVVTRLREKNITLPKIAEQAAPHTIAPEIVEALANVDADAADPLNLYRVHWYNDEDRRGCCQSNTNRSPKSVNSGISGRKLTPLSHSGRAVLLEDIAAV